MRSSGSGWRMLAAGVLGACLVPLVAAGTDGPERSAPTLEEQIARGRQVVIEHGCGDCHGGGGNPASPYWLAGTQPTPLIGQVTQVGPFKTYARNLTPDNATGLGRFTERQIFNAIRYGLRPGETPDVEITSTVPGQGNYPRNPKYLAPPMPWPVFRHMTDADIMALAAYLKHGVKPANNKVPDSEGPPDFWAGEYTVEKLGTYPAPPFPAAQEVAPKQTGAAR